MQKCSLNTLILRLCRAETGIKALKILGIEESAIANNDLVIFLYAVGLVGASH